MSKFTFFKVIWRIVYPKAESVSEKFMEQNKTGSQNFNNTK